MKIVTSSWFVPLNPDEFGRIGISRGVPRGQAGFRRYPQLVPGPWFNTVPARRYRELYGEILGALDPAQVVEDLLAMADGKTPALLCFEPPMLSSAWCHRGLVSAWLWDTLSLEVYEIGQECDGCGWSHPKIPVAFRIAR